MTLKTSISSLIFLSCLGLGLFAFPGRSFAEATAFSSIPRSILIFWDGGSETVPAETIGSWFRPTNTLRFQSDTQTEAISPTDCPWIASFCDFSLTESWRYALRSEVSFDFDEATTKRFLDSLRDRTKIDPTDAVFTVGANNVVSAFAPSRDGSAIDADAGLRLLESALSGSAEDDLSVKIPVISISPKVSSTDAEHLGITQLLGEGRTNFAGSPKNRIFNINRAIQQFQGVLIAPGEDFSFVKHLGEVDAEHGYLPELVIKQGKTEPEFGGGICQVSTTLFRAALNTGQKITERRNHAYPVSYYKPYGMDATIYIPKPDFRFTNNTPGYLLLQVAIEGSDLVFRVYGTPDGRSVSIDGPHILEHSPDGAMKTIFTQKVLAADGSTLIEDSFKSSYESPSKYPHPGTAETFTEKPKDWSQKQWDTYVKTGELPR